MPRTGRYIAPIKNKRTGRIDFRWLGRGASAGVTSPTTPVGPIGMTGVTKPRFLLDDDPPPRLFPEDDPLGLGDDDGFHATSSFDDYQSGLSIAARGAPDPYATWILPEWTIFALPGETAEGARWRYQMLQEQHPDWTSKQITAVIFGNEGYDLPDYIVNQITARADYEGGSNGLGISIPTPEPYRPTGPFDPNSGFIGSIIRQIDSPAPWTWNYVPHEWDD